MQFARNFIDKLYTEKRSLLFHKFKDPEDAHHAFVKASQRIHKAGLENFLFDCPENRLNPGFEISNAAGFNKDASIPPTFLKALGFDRVVVGAVTADPWPGNPRPRIVRYPGTESMVNWDLPGKGAKIVANNLDSFGNHGVPITINLMSTPDRTGDDLLDDLRETVMLTKYLHGVDRYELKIPCPNTHSASGNIDARKEYQNQLARMLKIVMDTKREFQQVYLKVSPDLSKEDIKEIIDVAHQYQVAGFTTTNTTTYHDRNFITHKPNEEGKGGASGNAVYDKSYLTQQLFREVINQRDYEFSLIACGGINSRNRVQLRTICEKVNGIQIFTPLIFKGPALLRELRRAERRRI